MSVVPEQSTAFDIERLLAAMRPGSIATAPG